jgi:hypothetical protein
VFRKFAQVIVAGSDFDPRIGYADERFLEIVIFQAASAQHGSRTGAVRSINQCVASRLEL